MVADKETHDYVNAYCRLRDRQYAVYARCAKRCGLTVNELFVLDILWFADGGCTQKAICERLSSNKQTVNAIVNRFLRKGFVELVESKADMRNKLIVLTGTGRAYAQSVIPPAADAENLAMSDLTVAQMRELVALTTAFTENTERRFAEAEGKKQ